MNRKKECWWPWPWRSWSQFCSLLSWPIPREHAARTARRLTVRLVTVMLTVKAVAICSTGRFVALNNPQEENKNLCNLLQEQGFFIQV